MRGTPHLFEEDSSIARQHDTHPLDRLAVGAGLRIGEVDLA